MLTHVLIFFTHRFFTFALFMFNNRQARICCLFVHLRMDLNKNCVCQEVVQYLPAVSAAVVVGVVKLEPTVVLRPKA